MVAAVCHLRLGNASDALAILQGILKQNPKNERALFHLAFCNRAEGKHMDALENLTKVGAPLSLVTI